VPDTIIPGYLEQDRLNGMVSIGATGNINLLNGSISSSVLGGLGNGGNLSILSKYTILNKSQIIANAYEGNVGNIDITADYLIQSSGSVISASSKKDRMFSVLVRHLSWELSCRPGLFMAS